MELPRGWPEGKIAWFGPEADLLGREGLQRGDAPAGADSQPRRRHWRLLGGHVPFAPPGGPGEGPQCELGCSVVDQFVCCRAGRCSTIVSEDGMITLS
jgi:hypothetical protein